MTYLQLKRQALEWKRTFDRDHPQATLSARDLYALAFEPMYDVQKLIFGDDESRPKMEAALVELTAMVDVLRQRLTEE